MQDIALVGPLQAGAAAAVDGRQCDIRTVKGDVGFGRVRLAAWGRPGVKMQQPKQMPKVPRPQEEVRNLIDIANLVPLLFASWLNAGDAAASGTHHKSGVRC